MSHAPWSEWIDDLVSGELPDERRGELGGHLESCEACRADLDALQALRTATRGLADRVDPPSGLEGEVRARLQPGRASPPLESAWLAVATAVVVAVGVLTWLRAPGVADLPGATLESFRRHSQGELPLALTTPDEGVLERFFDGTLGFRARVIDLRMMEYGLQGGRVHEILGRPSALYAYQGPDGRTVLCQMLPGSLEELPKPDEVHEERGFTFQAYRREGLTAVFWVEGAILCVLVSDIPGPALLTLAREKAMA